jgi:hypothetical protein
MLGDIAMKNSPPVVRDDKEAVENAEGERRHCEEIHCGDSLAMIAEKSHPAIRRFVTSWSFSHPTQDGSLGDVVAEHLQFAVNPRRTPGGVPGDHAENELAQFFARWPSSRADPMPRKPGPVQFEPLAMPANNRLRLDNDESLLPSGPEAPQHQPKQPIRCGKTRLWMLSSQDSKLLP